jgi:hypothetical protein
MHIPGDAGDDTLHFALAHHEHWFDLVVCDENGRTYE